MDVLSRDRRSKMDHLITSEEAMIGRGDSSVQFDYRIDDLISDDSEVEMHDETTGPKPKDLAKKARTAHVLKHEQQHTFPVFYVNSCPIRLSIFQVKIRKERAVDEAEKVDDEKEKDFEKWCRLTVVYRYKRLGCVCSKKKKRKPSDKTPTCPACRPAHFTLQATVTPYSKNGMKEDEDSLTLYKCNKKDKLSLLHLKKVGEYEQKKIRDEHEIRFCNNYESQEKESDELVLAKCRSANSIIVTTVASLVYIDQKDPLIRNVPTPIEVHQNIMRRVHDGARTDLVIKVENEDEEIHCHKAILEAHSDVFEKMFSIEMSEKRNSEVVIKDMALDTVKGIVEYIYTGQILHFARDLKTTVEILKASDIYCMEDLFECCRRLLYFSNFELLSDVETTAELLSFIYQCERPGLKVLDTKCFENFKLKKNELTENAHYEELMANKMLRELLFRNVLDQIPT